MKSNDENSYNYVTTAMGTAFVDCSTNEIKDSRKIPYSSSKIKIKLEKVYKTQTQMKYRRAVGVGIGP